MASQARVGLIVTAIGFLTGIWLFLAPFRVPEGRAGLDRRHQERPVDRRRPHRHLGPHTHTLRRLRPARRLTRRRASELHRAGGELEPHPVRPSHRGACSSRFAF
jgi:hypothetical protein